MNIRKNYFTERIVKHWNGYGGVTIPEVLKRHVDVALRNMA